MECHTCTENLLWLKDPSVSLAEGNTLLHCAVVSLDLRSIDALVQAGAPVNAVDTGGNSPLNLAASAHRQDAWAVIRTLLAAGAHVNHA
ncbi:MAG: ankyrin repeat domain-containing protein, partial [Chlamydiia bacterium]|nr:ankyrin repeat domain-containing protein [Chlamydiia bacterium]